MGEKTINNRIVIARYPIKHVNAFAHIAESKLASFPQMIASDTAVEGASYGIGWGKKIDGLPGGVMESGFFWDAAHIDTLGMYALSSLNTDEGYNIIRKHTLRPLPDLKSKYAQTNNTIVWEGVVLACQNPADRSILSVGTERDYWSFLEGACEKYKKDLFIKLHPWNNGIVLEKIKNIANKHGCRAEKCNFSVLDKCKFVLAYNSTFLVDCMVRGVKSAAFVPSAFSRYTHFTNGTYPNTVPCNKELATLFVNFLAYRYCFNHTMTAEKTIALFEHYSKSPCLFPMTDEYCYALNPSDPAAKGRKHS